MADSRRLSFASWSSPHAMLIRMIWLVLPAILTASQADHALAQERIDTNNFSAAAKAELSNGAQAVDILNRIDALFDPVFVGFLDHAVLTTVAVAVLSLSVFGPPVQAQNTPSAQELADLRALAEAGDTEAQHNLGLRYSTGEGVPQDDAEAITWYRLAAEQGSASAQNNLGV